MLPDAIAPHQLYIQHLGQEQGPYDIGTVGEMVRQRVLRTDTMAKVDKDGPWFPLGQVSGLFSQRDWIVAIAISWTVGWFGIDRFYLGYRLIGTLKLLVTVGGGAFWFFGLFVGAFDPAASDDAAPPGWIFLAYIPYLAAFVWHAADMIRITARKLPDADGLPLA